MLIQDLIGQLTPQLGGNCVARSICIGGVTLPNCWDCPTWGGCGCSFMASPIPCKNFSCMGGCSLLTPPQCPNFSGVCPTFSGDPVDVLAEQPELITKLREQIQVKMKAYQDLDAQLSQIDPSVAAKKAPK